ncbi:alpha-(1,3)-fucosyltransferase 9-like [Poecilia reticulata]|uniref:alpha-(1,3)-fucosyltransferase 9-like n=1 Tax=Poecilia reticulata TaxID=8081 RepID=UPI0004A35A9D|nr:PREDICTED: alpha-(1,3)-fucosyltransferase 9-like [Poecilia reticulata]
MLPTGQSKPSGTFHKILRPLLFSIFILGCFVTAFLMYFKPSTSWLNGPLESSDSSNHVKHVFAKSDKNMTTVLVWLWPFGQTYEMNICSSAFNIEGCFITIHKDYITEKLYIPLSVGTVPVVLGTTRENYENFVQGDAFIHVDDFSSPKELADYLLLLDKNEELYLGYFKWRRHFKVNRAHFWAEHTCQACAYLRQHKEYRAFNNLNKWYWG